MSKVPKATEARLISKNDIDNNFEFEEYDCCGGCGQCIGTRLKDSWIYNNNYDYWTMSSQDDSSIGVWYIYSNGTLGVCSVHNNGGRIFGATDKVVRPVVIIKKSVLGDRDASEENKINQDIESYNQENSKQETSIDVRVANTYMKASIIILLLGFISAGLGIFAYYKFSNKKK